MTTLARSLAVVVPLIASAAWAGSSTQVASPRFSALATQLRPAQPAAMTALAVPMVPSQPAPAPAHVAPSTTLAVGHASLDLQRIKSGKVVAVRDGRSQLVSEASVGDELRARQVLVDRTGSVAKAVTLSATLQSELSKTVPSVKSPEAVQLAYSVLSYDAGPEHSAIHLNPFLLDTTGLLLDAKEHGYVGMFVVALLDETNRDATGGLSPEVSVVVTAPGATLVPPIVKFDHYGPGAPAQVTVRVESPTADTFSIAASADFGATYNYAKLAVSRPTITVAPSTPAPIPGWGIGETTLHFAVSDVVSPEEFQLLLTGDTTGVSPNPVVFDQHGSGAIVWRSHGTGSSTIKAATPGTTLPSITVQFTIPWIFLVLTVGGGLLGAFLRGRGRDAWPKALAIGVGSALLMVVAYTLGFGEWVKALTGGATPAMTGEAIIVVLGALAALVGVSALVPKPQAG